MINQEYLLLGFGRQYIDDSIDLIETLKSFKDTRKISIIVNPSDVYYATNKKIFDRIIPFDVSKDELFSLCSTNFEKFCLLPRLRLPKFLSAQYTIVLDTDILCAYYTDYLWNYFIDKNQPLIMIGSKENNDWHWGNWGTITTNLDICSYETHGGLFFIDGSNSSNLFRIWDSAIYAFKNYDKLGMLRRYQGGAVDEPCFSYAFAKNDLIPIEFGEFPSITFNLPSSIDIPTKHMTEDKQKRIMNNYIPFIHMFEKNHTTNFKRLKNKILQHES